MVDEKVAEATVKEQAAIDEKINTRVSEEMYKADLLAKKEQHKAMRFRVPMNYNQNTSPNSRIHSTVPFHYLRKLAVNYPIARACIKRRISQMVQLGWEVTTKDEIENEDGYTEQIQKVKTWLKIPMGHKSRFREMISIMVEDLLSVDATSFEFQKTRGGEFISLIPVDPTTIVLRVDEQGGTPIPPETAYAQYIAGQRIAEFTTDEMVYESINSRSDSPYGLAPLESLIIQVESALRGALYNLAYFKESNVPEGFITLPEEVAGNISEIEEWQRHFDLLMSGDMRTTRRLKIIPGGSEYTPAKKPDDMSFEKFEMWLLQQTCAVFEVQPQDIGFTHQINKATAESQQNIGTERGLLPLANFIKEVIDDVIATEFEAPELQFIWTDINPVDRKEEADIVDKEIRIGLTSVDEERIARGKEPIGLGHFIMGAGGTPILVDEILANGTAQVSGNQTAEVLEVEEIQRWRRAIHNDLDRAKPLRTRFKSDKISPDVHKEISEALEGVHSKKQADLLFNQYTDPEIRTSMKLLEMATQMRKLEENV